MGMLTAPSDFDYYADLFDDEPREADDNARDDYDEDDAGDERYHFWREERD